MTIIRTPIVVLGCPRSGTSMVAGSLHHAGAWVGNCRRGDTRNVRGYFENMELRELLKTNPDDAEGIPDKAARILGAEGWDGEPWLVKCAQPERWRFWANAFSEAAWVLTHRPEESVIASRDMDGEYRELMTARTRAEQALLKSFEPAHVVVIVDDVIEGDWTSLRAAHEHVGLPWSDERAGTWVQPNLWHHKVPADNR